MWLYDKKNFGAGPTSLEPRPEKILLVPGRATPERRRARDRDWSRALAASGESAVAYSEMRSNTEKIGMYSAMIIDPMIAPSTAIINGSISEVSASVVASTSWS